MADFSAFSGRQADPGLDLGDQPPCWYLPADLLDGRFGVFLVHRETREWWRLVAVFASAERARAYASAENGATEWPEEIAERNAKHRREYPESTYEEKPSPIQTAEEWTPAPAVLPPEPPSGLAKIAAPAGESAAARNAREVKGILAAGPRSYIEIASALVACPAGSLHAALKRLFADGGAARDSDGKWHLLAAETPTEPAERPAEPPAKPNGPAPQQDPSEPGPQQDASEPGPDSGRQPQPDPAPEPQPEAEGVLLSDALKFLRDCGYVAMNLGGGRFSADGTTLDSDEFERLVNTERAANSLPRCRVELTA